MTPIRGESFPQSRKCGARFARLALCKTDLGQIQLAQSEESLVKLLRLGTLYFDRIGHREKIENGKRAERLMLSLLNRSAIPESRWRYFYVPKYNISQPRTSRYALLLRKAGMAETVYRHDDFRKYLRYFVFGADLPDATKEAFYTKFVETNRSRAALAQLARCLVRERQVDCGSQPSEIFYQLALDSGLELWDARALRDSVKTVKRK